MDSTSVFHCGDRVVTFDIADLYVKVPQAVIDYFYVPWMYCTAINLFPVCQ